MADSFNKKEKQKRKEQKKKEKAARKEARKAEEKGSGLDSMMAYVDANGNLMDTPPDETVKKEEIDAESIEIGVPKKEDLPEEDPIHQGKVTFFNDEKGYGFIKDKSSQDSYFVHMNNCKEPIGEGDVVEFELEPGQKGMAAVRVKKI